MVTPARLWRADACLLAVWRLANDAMSWKDVNGKRSPKFVYIHVPPLPALSVDAVRLILWQSDYAAWVGGLTGVLKDELKAFVSLTAPTPVAIYNHDTATVTKANVTRELLTLALALEGIALDATKANADTAPTTQGQPLETLATLALGIAGTAARDDAPLVIPESLGDLERGVVARMAQYEFERLRQSDAWKGR